MRYLVPDMGATIEVDPIEEHMRLEIGRFEHSAEVSEDEDAKAALAELIADLKAKLADWLADDEERPKIVIGYMPPAKRSAIRNQSYAMIKVDTEGKPVKVLAGDDLADSADRSDAIDREVVSWGARGWNLKMQGGEPVPFELVPERVAGVEYKRAAPEAVAVLEAMGWIGGLARAVMRFNTLSDEEKKRS